MNIAFPPTPHGWRILFSGSAFRPSLQTAPPMPRTGGLLWPLSWLSWALADTGCQCPCQWCPERVPRVISRPSWPPLSPTTILSTLIKPPPRRPLPRMSNRTDPSDTEPSELYGESFVVSIRSDEVPSEEPSWRNSSKMVEPLLSRTYYLYTEHSDDLGPLGLYVFLIELLNHNYRLLNLLDFIMVWFTQTRVGFISEF